MFVHKEHAEALAQFFDKIKLKHTGKLGSAYNADKQAKINQIVSYLEVIDSTVSKLSKKRTVTFVDSGAGNCYLSFLVYYYYNNLVQRPVKVYCIDFNERLMDNARETAKNLGFENMEFQAGDILDFECPTRIDVAYSLHACDTATDKAIYLGIKHNARTILSVTCCQHSLVKRFSSNFKGITSHRVTKEKLMYLALDSMRGILISQLGYKADIIEFTSPRNTGKNLMIRAKKGVPKGLDSFEGEYQKLSDEFKVEPYLATLVR